MLKQYNQITHIGNDIFIHLKMEYVIFRHILSIPG